MIGGYDRQPLANELQILEGEFLRFQQYGQYLILVVGHHRASFTGFFGVSSAASSEATP
jgi:hypothetical protein